METLLVKLLNEYKNKLSQYQNLKENLVTKYANSLKKNLKTIQKEFQDEISVISDSDVNAGPAYFNLPKTEDRDIGFGGILEFEIVQHRLRINRIGFEHQIAISFYKDEIKILDESYDLNKAYNQLDTKQFINVYKTVDCFLSHKDKIKSLLDDWLRLILEDKNQIVSKNIAWISQLP